MPRSIHARAFSLTCIAALCFLANTAHALQVTGIEAVNKRGQTFITWNNLPGSGWTYHVYASFQPMRTMADFVANAWELGSVGDSSSLDRRISTLLGQPLAFSTDSGGPPMTLTHGLFVTTPIEPGLMNYAILAENSIFPIDYHFYPSQNTTVDPVWEVAAVPKPIFQRRITTPRVDHYVLFASSNDIPGFPAMWGRENHALHFGVVPGKPGGALLMQGHGRGGSFLYAAYGTGRTDETVIAADDYLPTWDVSSFYLGYNNTYDPAVGNNPPASGGAVFDYTDRFVLYVMDWAKANYGYDEHRVYALGGSMGGSFAFFLAWHHPERIAAAFAVVPKTCAGYRGDATPTLTVTFERMWSPIAVDLPTIDGVPVYDWMDGRRLSERFENRGAAPVFGFVGRNDDVVGWDEKVLLFQALKQHRAGGAWYWDERTHLGRFDEVTWAPVQNDWARLYRYRNDRSYPALSNCSADSDPGDGTRTSGDAVGTMNGFVDWDEQFVDTRDRWECVLRPRTLQTLSGALVPPADMTVDVTPRRLQKFQVSDRTAYTYTVTDATTGDPIASGVLQADAGYLLTVPAVPVRAGGSRLALQPVTSLAVGDGAGPRLPRLALASNPVHGATTLQVDWPGEGAARVDLLDLAGRRIRTLFDAPGRGTAAMRIEASGLAPGIYLVNARQGSLQSSARVVIVR